MLVFWGLLELRGPYLCPQCLTRPYPNNDTSPGFLAVVAI